MGYLAVMMLKDWREGPVLFPTLAFSLSLSLMQKQNLRPTFIFISNSCKILQRDIEREREKHLIDVQ